MATPEFTLPFPAPAQPAFPQPASPAKPTPATRRLRVSYLGSFPYLRLKGRWFDEAGFGIGAEVQLSVAPGRLVLEVLNATAPPAKPLLKRRAR